MGRGPLRRSESRGEPTDMMTIVAATIGGSKTELSADDIKTLQAELRGQGRGICEGIFAQCPSREAAAWTRGPDDEVIRRRTCHIESPGWAPLKYAASTSTEIWITTSMF